SLPGHQIYTLIPSTETSIAKLPPLGRSNARPNSGNVAQYRCHIFETATLGLMLRFLWLTVALGYGAREARAIHIRVHLLPLKQALLAGIDNLLWIDAPNHIRPNALLDSPGPLLWLV